MRISALIATMALAPLVPFTSAVAQDADSDLIDGYRTNDFPRMLPEEIGQMRRASFDTDPGAHRVTARYQAQDGESFAVLNIYAWPPEGPQPIAPDGPETAEVVENIAEVMRDDYEDDPQTHDFQTEGGHEVACVHGVQVTSERVNHIFCAIPAKGRMLETQVMARIGDKGDDELMGLSEDFTGQLVDHVLAAE